MESGARRCTSATSTGGGATGVTVPSSSVTRSPMVAPILALACLNESDSFSCNTHHIQHGVFSGTTVIELPDSSAVSVQPAQKTEQTVKSHYIFSKLMAFGLDHHIERKHFVLYLVL